MVLWSKDSQAGTKKLSKPPMPTKKVLSVGSDSDVDKITANMAVIAIAGMAHELGLKIYVQRDIEQLEADIWYSDDTEQRMKNMKHEIEAALLKRLDPIMTRKIMVSFFGMEYYK